MTSVTNWPPLKPIIELRLPIFGELPSQFIVEGAQNLTLTKYENASGYHYVCST